MTNLLDPAGFAFNEAVAKIKRLHPSINANTGAVLADMYSAAELHGKSGAAAIPLDTVTRISVEQGVVLNHFLRQNFVLRSLEIGFAYGFSTVWILDGLASKTDTYHVAIDPFEISQWGGIGLTQVERLDYSGRFEWIEDFSIHALAKFIREGRFFDFVFIDGNHRFDDIIVDFYLADQCIKLGGMIALDDLWMDSVRTAVRFIVANRAYEIVEQPVGNMIVLRKLRVDERPWDHFIKF